MKSTNLSIVFDSPIKAENAGLFVMTQEGRHPKRIIDSFELIFVISGVLKIGEEGQDFAVGKNQYLILWPKRWHYGIADYERGLNFYWLHFVVEDIQKTNGNSVLNIPRFGTVPHPESLIELFRRFLDEQESGCNFTVEKDLLALLLLCEAGRPMLYSEEIGQATILVERVRTYIITHLDKPLSRSVIARRLSCNPDYLGRVVQKICHKCITTLINDFRIKRATQLLVEGNSSVEEISDICGYADVRYFRCQFKKRKGMTPTQYRKLFTKTHVNTC